jgi:pilus assembly protein CpaF
MVILTLTEKGGEPRQLTFEKNEVTVGRVQGNDVVLPKGNVSKRHCRIYVQDGHFAVEDLKSTNGTYVNGRKITESTVVSTADKVYVGDFVIRVDSAAQAEVPTPPPPAGNEAGSLSTALPRRPPPPPPPRMTGGMRSLEEEVAREPGGRQQRSSSRISLPPPPPPPKRESMRAPAMLDDDLPLPPPAPADIDLDDESLAPPRLNVPPLKPVLAVSDDDDRPLDPPPARHYQPPPMSVGAPTHGGTSHSGADYPTWLRRLLDAEGTSAVYVAGPYAVEVDRQGRRETVALSPADADGLVDSLRSLAGRGSPRPAPDAAVVNVTLPDGSRLVAVFPPVAGQVCAAIQRSGGGDKGLADLVSEGALSREMQQVLEACSGTRRNVLVTGDRRAAGLLLQALANTVPSHFRVVVLADSVVAPPGGASWIKLAAQPHRHDLMTAAVALHPDYLILEVAAAASAGELLQECAVGQEGVFAAVAGRSSNDALARLQGLASAGTGGAGVRDLIVGSFDLVVHAASAADGGVRVLEIAEPRLESDGKLVAEPLLVFRAEDGRGNGRYQPTGSPSRLAATLAARGVQIPAAVLPR